MKTILITGTSSGIGEESAKLFSSKGWQVLATMRDPSKDQTLSKLPNVKIYKLDVTKYEEMKELVLKLQKEYTIDVLFSNAGYGMKCPLELSSDEENRNCYETNLFGAMNLISLFIPYFKGRKSGTIICTSSLAGIIALPLDGIYGAAKRALTSMCESIYYELKPYNVAVKILLPGGTVTKFKMIPIRLDEYEKPNKQQQKYLRGGEEKFTGPEECAQAAFDAATDNKDQLHYPGDHIAKKLLEEYYSMGIEKFKEYFSNMYYDKK